MRARLTLSAGQLHAHSGEFADAGLKAAAHIARVLERRLHPITLILQGRGEGTAGGQVGKQARGGGVEG